MRLERVLGAMPVTSDSAEPIPVDWFDSNPSEVHRAYELGRGVPFSEAATRQAARLGFSHLLEDVEPDYLSE